MGGVACAFGLCTRADASGDNDWYEPDQLLLKRGGLPWFYFISGVDNLADEFREQYVRESTQLWGEHDGLK